MRKNKMTILGCMGIFLIAALLLLPVTQARAKDVKIKISSYLTKVEVIPVPGVKGHVVGLYERRGVAVFEDGETASYLTRGSFDYNKGQGPFRGYSQITYMDGSTSRSKYQGITTVPPGEKLPSFKGTGEYINGTGRFEGIKGKFSFSGKYVTPYTKDKTKGDAYYEVTGTYTLPKK